MPPCRSIFSERYFDGLLHENPGAPRRASVHLKSFAKILEEAKVGATDTDRFDIFLSHSIQDAELIAGVRQLLEQQGFVIYVDWENDPQLDRKAVSKETAAILRKRMRQSAALIYVATENTSSSKWMPWELGYFDGYKPDQVAVLPLMNGENDGFPEQEYLGLYPLVRKDQYTNGMKDVFVEDVGRRWTTLKTFGKGSSAWNRYVRS